jgi:hypothetical protein
MRPMQSIRPVAATWCQSGWTFGGSPKTNLVEIDKEIAEKSVGA